jgi:hypothetical protein
MNAQSGNGRKTTLSLTSVIHWVGGQHHAPAALPPGNTRYPLCRRMGGPQGRSGRVRKISPPPGSDPRAVQPVASTLYRWRYPGQHTFYYTFIKSRKFIRMVNTTYYHYCCCSKVGRILGRLAKSVK